MKCDEAGWEKRKWVDNRRERERKRGEGRRVPSEQKDLRKKEADSLPCSLFMDDPKRFNQRTENAAKRTREQRQKKDPSAPPGQS